MHQHRYTKWDALPATGTVTCYPTQSHYPDTEPTSHCPILIMPSARLGRDIGLTRPGFENAKSGFPDHPEPETDALHIQPL